MIVEINRYAGHRKINKMLGAKTRSAILNTLECHPEGIPVIDLAEQFGISRVAMGRHLRKLERSGTVELLREEKNAQAPQVARIRIAP